MLSRVLFFTTPWTVAPQAPLSMGFSRQYWSGLLFPPLGDLPDSGIKPEPPASSALAGGFFTTESPRKQRTAFIPSAKQGQTQPWSFVVWSPSHVRLFAIPWTVAHKASLSLTISQSLPKFMSIETVMPSNHLILLSLSSLDLGIIQSPRCSQNQACKQVLCEFPSWTISNFPTVLSFFSLTFAHFVPSIWNLLSPPHSYTHACFCYQLLLNFRLSFDVSPLTIAEAWSVLILLFVAAVFSMPLYTGAYKSALSLPIFWSDSFNFIHSFHSLH